ncbi:unnamed protein product [Candidula unifasciata]|uniref:Uncharacterized protein n=1 Tax=Candidula unifasciata TaxID=100452 RepID=A0A8S3ZL27_9EUPU|nr:unnamed protein product [Candidula unifasciata]
MVCESEPSALKGALLFTITWSNTRRRCRSTQTLSAGTDSDSDSDGSPPWKSPRGPNDPGDGARGTSSGKGTQSSQLRGPPGAVGRSLNTSRSNLSRFPRHNDSQDSRIMKKSFGANATMESESEESGYGDTYGDTLNALSEDHSFFIDSEQLHTPMTDIESDDESTGTFISGEFISVDSENLIHVGTQTPGHVRTQTQEWNDFRQTNTTQTEFSPRAVGMQTSTTSLHSIGAQTKKLSGSRINLLKGILSEVKNIKKQHDLNVSRDEISITSDMSINGDILDHLYCDLANLREAGAKGDAATQTQNDQSSQTSRRLFHEVDSQMQARQCRMNDMLDEIRRLRTENQSIAPSYAQSKMSDFGVRTPFQSSSRNMPAELDFHRSFTHQLQSPVRSAREQSINHAHWSAVGMVDNYPQAVSVGMPGASRHVTQNDLNNINERLDRLQKYRMPYQEGSLPTYYQQHDMAKPPQTRTVASRSPATPRHRYRVQELTRSYDDIDILSSERRRNRAGQTFRDGVMDRYHLDDALLEATRSARQLKRMSAKMKLKLREELNRSRY